MFDEEYRSRMRVTKMDLLELDEESRRYAHITRNINNFYDADSYEFNYERRDPYFFGHGAVTCDE